MYKYKQTCIYIYHCDKAENLGYEGTFLKYTCTCRLNLKTKNLDHAGTEIGNICILADLAPKKPNPEELIILLAQS